LIGLVPIEDGETVVASGGVSIAKQRGDMQKFVFCEVFTFTGDAVSRLDTYHWSSPAFMDRVICPASSD
jgi:hypothetical protein